MSVTEILLAEGQRIQLTGKMHVLKCVSEPFNAICDGRKTHEVRVDDRGYMVGDVLVLREYDRKVNEYSGWEVRVLVTYITEGGSWSFLPEGTCVMSIAILRPKLKDAAGEYPALRA